MGLDIVTSDYEKDFQERQERERLKKELNIQSPIEFEGIKRKPSWEQ